MNFTVEQVATVCHEANRMLASSLKEEVLPEWYLSPESLKETVKREVLFAIRQNPTPQDLHQAWVDYKLQTGWKYGVVKNEDLKEHPYIISYEMLPDSVKLRDKLFLQIIGTFKDQVVVDL